MAGSNFQKLGGDDMSIIQLPGPMMHYTYYSGGTIPPDTTHLCIHSTVSVIPPELCYNRTNLVELELCCNNGSSSLREIGRRAFGGCINLQFKVGTNIPCSVMMICEEAFTSCRSITEVIIPPGVLTISRGTFHDCTQLHRCVLPPSIRSIKCDSFNGSSVASFQHRERVDQPEEILQLLPVLPEDVVTIGDTVFKDCFFARMRIPPGVTTINRHLFYACKRMNSLELPEGISRIKNYAFMDCSTLRNVAIPPNAGRGGLECFDGCTDLFELFGTNKAVKDALKKRFRGLHLNRICYFSSYYDTQTTICNIRSLQMADGEKNGSYSNRIRDRDCLGMTPLHILACSSHTNMDLYIFFLDEFKERCRMYTTTEDRWGCLPFFYALLNNSDNSESSRQVRTFFLDCLTKFAPKYIFNVRHLVESLCRCGASLDALKFIFDMHHHPMFPHESVDWDQFVEELASSSHAKRVPVELFRYLIYRAIHKRVTKIGVSKWRAAIPAEVNLLQEKGNMRHTELKGIKLKLAFAEYSYDQLRESTCILELALWRAQVNECVGLGKTKCSSSSISSSSSSTSCLLTTRSRSNKRMKMDRDSIKQQCRINCGAEVIIRNVLPYLIENMI